MSLLSQAVSQKLTCVFGVEDLDDTETPGCVSLLWLCESGQCKYTVRLRFVWPSRTWRQMVVSHFPRAPFSGCPSM